MLGHEFLAHAVEVGAADGLRPLVVGKVVKVPLRHEVAESGVPDRRWHLTGHASVRYTQPGRVVKLGKYGSDEHGGDVWNEVPA